MFATLENYNRGNIGILEKPAAVEMLLKCRETASEFIEIRETECYAMRPERPRTRRQAQRYKPRKAPEWDISKIVTHINKIGSHIINGIIEQYAG